jgi:membrane protease YdiL (CAAX protease family)
VASAFGADFDSPGVTIAGTVWQGVCFIASALLFARMTGPPRPWQFGLRATRILPALGWMAVAWVAFYAFTGAWVGLLGLDPDEDQLPEQLGVDESTAAMLGAAFLVAVVAPVAEEFFFRGFFFSALRNWKGTWPAALISGLVFGAIHAGSSDPAFLVPLAFFGVALCLLFVRTGSLYPPIALHCANNALAFGATQDWTWQIPVLFTCALALIWLTGRAVGRIWTPRPPAPAAAAAT